MYTSLIVMHYNHIKISVKIYLYIKYAFMFLYFRYMDINFGSILCIREKTQSRHTNYRRTLKMNISKCCFNYCEI